MSKQEQELEVVEAPVEEEEKVETPEEVEAKQKKAALAAFILGIIAFVIGSWFGGLLGIILGAIAIGKAKKAKGIEVNPSKIFRLIGLILGIIGLVFGILDLLFCIFVLPVLILGGVIAVIAANWPAIQQALIDAGVIQAASALALLAVL